MSDITTCRICLQKIQQEPELELNDLTPRPKFEFESEQDLSITENPVACNKCKVEIDSDSYFVKEEIKREEDIKTEDLVDDDCTLLNNKIPLCVEENKPVIVLYYCDKCGYDTDDKKNLTDHVFTHRFKCNRCSYTTPDNYSRIIHKQIHGISQSSIRNYTSNSLDSVRLSVNEEKTNKGSFQCHACDYRSVSKTTLMFHMKTHKMILCDLCNFQTHSRSSLNCHRLTVHKIGSADNIALKNRNSEQITEATAKKRFNRIKIIKCELSTNPNYFGRPFLRMGRLISKKRCILNTVRLNVVFAISPLRISGCSNITGTLCIQVDDNIAATCAPIKPIVTPNSDDIKIITTIKTYFVAVCAIILANHFFV